MFNISADWQRSRKAFVACHCSKGSQDLAPQKAKSLSLSCFWWSGVIRCKTEPAASLQRRSIQWKATVITGGKDRLNKCQVMFLCIFGLIWNSIFDDLIFGLGELFKEIEFLGPLCLFKRYRLADIFTGLSVLHAYDYWSGLWFGRFAKRLRHAKLSGKNFIFIGCEKAVKLGISEC